MHNGTSTQNYASCSRFVAFLFDICQFYLHDDVIKWKHFPRYWPFCEGNSLVTGEFPSQRPVTRSFDVFFDLCLNKRLSKQSRGWRFETPSRSLWRHCNVILQDCVTVNHTLRHWEWYHCPIASDGTLDHMHELWTDNIIKPNKNKTVRIF